MTNTQPTDAGAGPAERPQDIAQPQPQVGQRYTHRPGVGDRTVTVTGVSQTADGIVVAYEWNDGGPGRARGVVPLDVFHRVYKPEQPATDTLPQWLSQRFDSRGPDWGDLSDADRDYWAHEAAAVRRAVARGGFKDQSGAQQ